MSYISQKPTVFILSCIILFFLPLKEIFQQEINSPDTLIILHHTDTIQTDLNEVVVTGTRIPKKIIDIPYSVVRINNMDYRYNKQIGVDDALSSVPGMFLQSRYGNHDVRISIRGFGSRSNSGIRGVRILLDDIPESEPDGQTRIEAIDFNSIGRIEIAKGNASSLYTNAPGGVVNFINDMDFDRSYAIQFNQIGSFGLGRHGVKTGVRSGNYRFLNTYSYQSFDGYRVHNNEHWHILNTVLETHPGDHSSLKIMFYFVDGFIKLPGALTKEEFDKDPFQANQRSVDRDEKRKSTKGRLGIRYNTRFGKSFNNEIEITTYGTIKYFERTSRYYRIINRYGLGLGGKYMNRFWLGNRKNEFSIGGDLLMQPARTEFYDNISGKKGDQLFQLYDEKINNAGFYISDNFEILPEKLFVLLTGRYDNVGYKLTEETLPSRNDKRTFHAFTPKLALNYKLTSMIALYTSFGLSFDSPAKNELESVEPSKLYNQDLESQESQNFELGIKGTVKRQDADLLKEIRFEATIFNILIDNEIVPFEVLGDVFYRNAAKSNRLGMELGGLIEIIKDLNFILAYTFSDFKYDKYLAKSIEVDSSGNIIELQKDFSGNFAPSVPKNNLFLACSYSYPVHRKINGFIKVSYNGVSGLWVDDANTDQTKRYDLVNTVLGFDLKFGKFNILISGGIYNIFDGIYVGFTNTNSADKRYYEAGEPRAFFGSLKIGYTFK